MTNASPDPRPPRRARHALVVAAVVGLTSALFAGPAAAAPKDRVVCPGTFQVLHNDRVGQLEIPAGAYRITVRRMTCPDASDKFRRFLNIPSGRLPDNWQVRPAKSKFRNSVNGQSFRIKRTGS
jgi:hypothetical protein